uniref:DRBM domain-containing protein n=1 Tax=Panagrellus redivivus TaxID=6233 RepID=A0A7E4UXF4_PANRE
MSTTVSFKSNLQRLEVIVRELSKPNADVTPEMKNDLNSFVTAYHENKMNQFIKRTRDKSMPDTTVANGTKQASESCESSTLGAANELQNDVHKAADAKRASNERNEETRPLEPMKKKFRLLDGTIVNPPPDVITWAGPSSSKEDIATKQKARTTAAMALLRLDGLVTEAGILRTSLGKKSVSSSAQTETLSTECPSCVARAIVKRNAKSFSTQYDEADYDILTAFAKTNSSESSEMTVVSESQPSEPVDVKESTHPFFDKKELTETVCGILRDCFPMLNMGNIADKDQPRTATPQNVDAVCHSSTVSPVPEAQAQTAEKLSSPHPVKIKEEIPDSPDIEIVKVVNRKQKSKVAKIESAPSTPVSANTVQDHVVKNIDELAKVITEMTTKAVNATNQAPEAPAAVNSSNSSQIVYVGILGDKNGAPFLMTQNSMTNTAGQFQQNQNLAGPASSQAPAPISMPSVQQSTNAEVSNSMPMSQNSTMMHQQSYQGLMPGFPAGNNVAFNQNQQHYMSQFSSNLSITNNNTMFPPSSTMTTSTYIPPAPPPYSRKKPARKSANARPPPAMMPPQGNPYTVPGNRHPSMPPATMADASSMTQPPFNQQMQASSMHQYQQQHQMFQQHPLPIPDTAAVPQNWQPMPPNMQTLAERFRQYPQWCMNMPQNGFGPSFYQ